MFSAFSFPSRWIKLREPFAEVKRAFANIFSDVHRFRSGVLCVKSWADAYNQRTCVQLMTFSESGFSAQEEEVVIKDRNVFGRHCPGHMNSFK